jgi:hypothetical protein
LKKTKGLFKMTLPLGMVGQSEEVNFPELGLIAIPSRIDTGARTSTIWVSSVKPINDGIEVILFGIGSEFYTGSTIFFADFETRVVTPSNGLSEERYMVKLLTQIGGRKVRARFTLADRSKQSYPVLIGRNILRGKFVVDIKHNHIKVKAKLNEYRKLKES